MDDRPFGILIGMMVGCILMLAVWSARNLAVGPIQGLVPGRVVQVYHLHYATVVRLDDGRAVECLITAEQTARLSPGAQTGLEAAP